MWNKPHLIIKHCWIQFANTLVRIFISILTRETIPFYADSAIKVTHTCHEFNMIFHPYSIMCKRRKYGGNKTVLVLMLCKIILNYLCKFLNIYRTIQVSASSYFDDLYILGSHFMLFSSIGESKFTGWSYTFPWLYSYIYFNSPIVTSVWFACSCWMFFNVVTVFKAKPSISLLIFYTIFNF